MWLLIALYGSVTLLLAWILFGYFIFMFIRGRLHTKKPVHWPHLWPKISLIIPFYNEAQLLVEKLKDTISQDYPMDRIEIFLVDGHSTDGSLEIMKTAAAGYGNIRLLESPRQGKIHQINYALGQITDGLVVVTDVDARLEKDALKWLAAEFEADPQLNVLGAYCVPQRPIDIEYYYWNSQNRARLIESDAGMSSIVVAPCYGFRRDLLDEFPQDVIADDIYIAFQASSRGYKTKYARKVLVTEIRTPVNYGQFFSHKYRKANAFLRESLRFMYLLGEISGLCKTMLLTRLAQQLLYPWALILWIAIGGSLAGLERFDVLFTGILFLMLLLLITSVLFKWVRVPLKTPLTNQEYGLRTTLQAYVSISAILLITGLTYPFYEQDCVYRRLGNINGNMSRKNIQSDVFDGLTSGSTTFASDVPIDTPEEAKE